MSESQVVRMNISVLRELKARMDKVSAQVNWSETAAQAFEAKLLELTSKKEADTMEDAIARLRAAAALEADKDYQDGLEAGREWAKRLATPRQLQRLTEYTSRIHSGGPWWRIGTRGKVSFPGATDHFAFAVLGLRRDAREQAATDGFWAEAVDQDELERIMEDGFFHGFGDGAAEVWCAVCGEVLTEVNFPQGETWDFNRDVVAFPAVAGGRRIRCMISLEALAKRYGARLSPDRDEALKAFRANRHAIEDVASRLIQAGRVDSKGELLIKTVDV